MRHNLHTSSLFVTREGQIAMKNLWQTVGEIFQKLFKGFGSNRPVGAIIRFLADLPDSRDLIPDKLYLNTVDGSCPVCGESFGEKDSDYVVCKDCFTPHHKQCFEWNGKCAQYACGSKQMHRLNTISCHFPTASAASEKLLSHSS